MRRDVLLSKLGEREITDPAAVTKELARLTADPSKALEVQAPLSSRVRGVSHAWAHARHVTRPFPQTFEN